MSIKNIQQNALGPRHLTTKIVTTPWVRNPSWLSLPSISSSDQKFAAVKAVFNEEGNYLSLGAAGAYTVDWGDGTVENYATGVQAYHLYDYNNTALNGTNAPVTLTDSGDLITRTNHGYTNGMRVQFWNIVSTTGISEAQYYYVINAATNTFQISATIDGTALPLTTDGTATLLPYKQVIITVTPQAGNNLTILSLNRKHNVTNLNVYECGYLDIKIGSPNLTAFNLVTGTITVNMAMLEQVELVSSTANITTVYTNLFGLESVIIPPTTTFSSISSMFQNCYALTTVPLLNTSTNNTTASMFQNCYSLTTVPLFNTAAVTNMANMFQGCSSLQSVPLFNTTAVTNMGAGMFSSCSSLQSVPLFNTSLVNNMSSMFSGCSSLQSVPLFNTAAVTTMATMFQNCYSLFSVPLFNTALVTTMANMFLGCSSLQSVPLFNTSLVNNMSSMFSGCYSLVSVPLFNTAAVTTMASMFSGCSSLQSVPLFNTSVNTTMTNMFNNCITLQSIPLFNSASVTATGLAFNSCSSLSKAATSNLKVTTTFSGCKLSTTELNNIISALGITSSAQSLTLTANYGSIQYNLAGTTTAGSTTVTMASTANLQIGMNITGSGISAPAAVTFTDAGDLVNWTNHGLTNGSLIRFSTIVTTTGIVTTTSYYVVNATTNDFQVSTTSGGAALPLTNDGTGTMYYQTFITAINPNVSITLSSPATASGSITSGSSVVNRQLAVCKGFTTVSM